MTARPLRRGAALSAASLLVGVGIAALGAAPAYAASFVVTTTAASGAGSFCDAFTTSLTNGGADTITFDLSGSAPWTVDAPCGDFFSESLTITGPTGDPADLTLDLDGNEGFYATGPSDGIFEISGLTMINGGYEYLGGIGVDSFVATDVTLQENDSAEGIDLYSGTEFTLTGVEVHDANADGIFIGNGATGSIIGSTISGNAGDGIEFDFDADLTITDTTVADNGYVGLYALSSSDAVSQTLSISGSTFSGNAEGGAWIYPSDGDAVSIVNSTFSGNLDGADEGGWALYVEGPETATFDLLHSTVTENVGESTLWSNLDGTISHSIVAGNDTPIYGDVCVSGDVTVEWSLIGTVCEVGIASKLETSSSVEAAALIEGEDVTLDVTDPGLEPLADNGGLTQTHLLLSTSPALDGGNPDISGEPETDQRGEARVAGSAIDIGSVEVDQTLAATGVETDAPLGAATLLLLLGAALLTARTLRRRTA